MGIGKIGANIVIIYFVFINPLYAYNLAVDSWEDGQTAFHVNIPDNDGLWDVAFENAMFRWNSNTVFTFFIFRDSSVDPCRIPTNSDAKNSVKFDSTHCGDAFGENTLASESTWTVSGDNTKSLQSRIIFNNKWLWDVYDAPYSSGIWSGIKDFRRVAVHELGHALGLLHTDIVGSMMTPTVDDIINPQADDISGVAALYDKDSDSIGIADDNCPLISNSGQLDTDSDGMGNVCDPDIDNDGIPDSSIIDQKQTSFSGLGFTIPGSDQLNLSQTVTAGIGGTLKEVQLGVSCTSGELFVDIQRIANNKPNGEVLTSETFSNTNLNSSLTFTSLVFSSPVSFFKNEQFAIVLSTSGSCFIANGVEGNSYSGGNSLFNNTSSDGWVIFSNEEDLPFQTVVDPSNEDNCPLHTNNDQLDTDGDGVGDVCDTDVDNDTLPDGIDNCPLIANSGQENNDGDNLGDICDPDDDNDGFDDTSDNCPLVMNANQDNNDGDSLGDVCDPDDDSDGVADTSDNCPFDADEANINSDGDGLCNTNDTDDDNDGVGDNADAFPFDPSETKDTDNDGVGDNADAFPLDASESVDTDGDGVGNNTDLDDDGDGMSDEDEINLGRNPTVNEAVIIQIINSIVD